MARRRYEEYEEEEPTFSLHDFKKWLQQQNGDDEALQEANTTEEFHKDELKEKFKENFKEKLRKRRKKKD